ncbi:lipid II:glycine glycyltransferase FemX [Streptomyces tagetis]|uniref:Peptidoglycan bridge formation glycyltransferase FemA/FemB family protein n=1 Tax=Streptomyces tagetis TaxID=2820809 RepID=A0A940XGZ4_9ACTN|nr:peptidoglycan bridge formation glycyltransferase FemA/FemB family protein [Streptomyces sp. RG38]MBQ0826371.1 peptidoglycan bridge formation glycyltransferase FemA/FemB family protein [Streptomyces sp. RG38]
MSHELKAITREEHLRFIADRPSVSPLQVPAWGEVKPEWRAESLGWFDRAGRLTGAGLVLLRPLPLPGPKRYLAYLPEGPDLHWGTVDLAGLLRPMLAYLKGQGAFAVRMGPPVVARCWSADAVKAAIADPRVRRLGDVTPTAKDPGAARIAGRLRALGWRRPGDGGGDGFASGQPRHVCRVPLAGRSLEDVQGGFNQQWRRNIKKAERAGVKVVRGDQEDLRAFHELYVETAERDRFTPRPLSYFRRMWTALTAEHPDRMRLYLAHHDGDVLAAATMLTVGDHVWYSYGASTSRGRDVRPSNALQWRMMSDAHELGASVYDFRGIGDRLDADDPLLGLLRFKIGAGGEAVEYLGEWEYPLNRLLHRALGVYLSRR